MSADPRNGDLSNPDERADWRRPGHEAAIHTRALSKTYQVYAKPSDRMKQMLWRDRRTFYRAFEAVKSVDGLLSDGRPVSSAVQGSRCLDRLLAAC